MMKKKIVTIIGARPQFIKAAVLSRIFKKSNNIEEIIVHTGQHYDEKMSEIFFEELNIPNPKYNLSVGSGSHGMQTGKMLIDIESVLLKEKPDLVLLYGDTNSTVAGAIAASKIHIPIAHVEAGLRSFNKKMPEEINRILTDHVSMFLFCPTKDAIKNLQDENLIKNIFAVGDVMYDSMLFASQKTTGILSKLGIEKEDYVLATIHRAENTDFREKLESIFTGLNQINKRIILPAHPRLLNKVSNHQLDTKNIKLIEPISYLEMVELEKNSTFIITDSGGVQKEAYFLKKPCITVREETEWVETVESGWNQLTGTNSEEILKAVKDIKIPESRENYYGDGNAGEKIYEIISVFLNES